jgi:sugar phosphate isomerase/epimerase
MKVFVSSACLWRMEMPDILRFADSAGFAGVEVWSEQIRAADDAPRLRRIADELDLDLSVHAASWDINICAYNAAIRQASIGEIQKALSLARDLNAVDVTIHPGRRSAALIEPEVFEKLLARSLRDICRYAEPLQVKISLEVMEKIPREFVTSPQEVNSLLAALAPLHCGITLDTAHLDSAEMFFGYLAAMPGVDKIHLSNRKGNNLHTHTCQGDIVTVSILRYLRNKSLPVVIEGSVLGEEELRCILRRIQAIEQKAA